MTRLKLTKKSEDQLYLQYNATGVVFIKTGEREITSFEFYRTRNGKLYLTDAMGPFPLATRLDEQAALIPEEE